MEELKLISPILLVIPMAIVIPWALLEVWHTQKVCPIWSDTLNELMNADVDVVEGDLTAAIGPARVSISQYSYGAKSDYQQNIYADRNTQKRLREYIARKRAIKMFDQVKAMQS